MTTYALPEQPTGPVWDKNGDKWELDEDTHDLFQRVTGERKGRNSFWGDLLVELGPVTDKPPVKVGDVVSDAADLEALPAGSIVAETGEIPFYKDSLGRWVNCYGLSENVLTGLENVILRIGKGDEQ